MTSSPSLREKYEGKPTEFETLAKDENDERKVAIRLLTVVDNKGDGDDGGFGFFSWANERPLFVSGCFYSTY